MKLGAENKKQVIILGVIGALALVLVVRTFFFGDDSGPAPATAPSPAAALNGATATANAAGAAAPRPAAPVTNARGKRPKPIPNPLDPRLHFDQLQGTEGLSYEGNGRNIFAATAEIPQVVKSPRLTKEQKKAQEYAAAHPPTPPIPQPPAITLKFFGFASKAGEPKKVFLSQGEDIFVASEGDVVSRRYRVVKINPNSVEIEDTLTKHTQNIPLTLS